jgi:hypothetical protein
MFENVAYVLALFEYWGIITYNGKQLSEAKEFVFHAA